MNLNIISQVRVQTEAKAQRELEYAERELERAKREAECAAKAAQRAARN